MASLAGCPRGIVPLHILKKIDGRLIRFFAQEDGPEMTIEFLRLGEGVLLGNVVVRRCPGVFDHVEIPPDGNFLAWFSAISTNLDEYTLIPPVTPLPRAHRKIQAPGSEYSPECRTGNPLKPELVCQDKTARWAGCQCHGVFSDLTQSGAQFWVFRNRYPWNTAIAAIDAAKVLAAGSPNSTRSPRYLPGTASRFPGSNGE